MNDIFKFDTFMGEKFKVSFPSRPNTAIELKFIGSCKDNNGCYFAYQTSNRNYMIVYNKISETIKNNKNKFEQKEWGFIKGDCAIIRGNILDEIIEKYFIEKSEFIDWAVSVGIIIPDKNRNPKKVTNLSGSSVRCYNFIIDFDFDKAR